MKRLSFILFSLALLLPSFGKAQSSKYSIEQKGHHYYQRDLRLRINDMLYVMRLFPEAYEEMHLAKRNYQASIFLVVAGGAVFAYPLVASMEKGGRNLVLVGLGLALGAVPFRVIYAKRSQEAVRLYNKNVQGYVYLPPKWTLGFADQGLGLKLSF